MNGRSIGLPLCALPLLLGWATACQDRAPTPAPTVGPYFSLIGLRVERAGQPPVVLTQDAERWWVEGEPRDAADARAVAAIEAAVRAPWRALDARPMHLSGDALGLTGSEAIRVALRPSDAPPIEVTIGRTDGVPPHARTWVWVAGTQDAIAVRGALRPLVERPRAAWHAPQLAPVAPEEVLYVEAATSGRDTPRVVRHAWRRTGRWIGAPLGGTIASSRVRHLLRALASTEGRACAAVRDAGTRAPPRGAATLRLSISAGDVRTLAVWSDDGTWLLGRDGVARLCVSEHDAALVESAALSFGVPPQLGVALDEVIQVRVSDADPPGLLVIEAPRHPCPGDTEQCPADEELGFWPAGGRPRSFRRSGAATRFVAAATRPRAAHLAPAGAWPGSADRTIVIQTRRGAPHTLALARRSGETLARVDAAPTVVVDPALAATLWQSRDLLSTP